KRDYKLALLFKYQYVTTLDILLVVNSSLVTTAFVGNPETLNVTIFDWPLLLPSRTRPIDPEAVTDFVPEAANALVVRANNITIQTSKLTNFFAFTFIILPVFLLNMFQPIYKDTY
ncbi:MAG TPA: hypothetical protein PKA28_20135, partial [Methylomusa anaerophila]|uniref:hypothetical protein n=1 Tax=Methylomusa anaerophila TaxID=1930071 RepID=UPI002BFC6E44